METEELFDNDDFEFEDELFQINFEKERQSNNNNCFIYKDFGRSGISKETIDLYVKQGYLSENEKYWKLFYPELTANIKTCFYTIRLKSPKEGQGKYIKPKGDTTKLFRPLALSPEKILDKNEPLIITEGDKKAIKAVEEGFNCISLSGTWNWKMKPINNDEDQNKLKDTEEAELYADIIPDLKNIDFEGKEIYLCYDADLWEKPQVKQALYQFSAFLISEKDAVVKIILLPKGGAKGIDDFLIAHGKDEFKKLIYTAKTVTLKDVQAELAEKKKIIKFPIDVFPNEIAKLILEMHKQYDAPLEYIACVFLSVVAIIICGKYCILARESSNWQDFPILWIALIGNPSQKKTPCLKIGKDILDDFDRILDDEYQTKLKEYYKKMQVFKKAKKVANKDSENDNYMPEPEKPLRTRFTVQNITVESMFDIIRANMEASLGVALYLDELSFLFDSFNQYKKRGNDKQYYLQSWSRNKQNVVRKSSKIDYKVDVGHNIIGGIQPKILYKALFGSGIEISDGMIERWLYCCSEYIEQGFSYDESNRLYENPQDEDNEFKTLCRNIFTSILQCQEKLRTFKFNSEASKIFTDFCNQVIKSKKSDNKSDLTKSYLQKQTNYVARFSLILQCFYDHKNTTISADIVAKAIKLSCYFISCFSNIVNDKINSNWLEDTALTYIKTKGLKTISPSQLFKSNENKYKTTKKARTTLENLARKGYGRLIKAKHGTKFVFYGS